MKFQKKIAEKNHESGLLNQLQLQATILENITDSVIATDLHRKIIYWNKVAEKVFGYSANEMLGKTPEVLYLKIDKKRLKEDFKKIEKGMSYIGEWQGKHKDDSLVWIDAISTKLFDAAGKTIGFISIAKDITEKKLSEKKLKTIEAKVQKLFESDIIGVFTSKFDGTILEANKTFLNMIGYTYKELLAGKIHRDILTPSEYKHISQQAVKSLQTVGSAQQYEKVYIHKSGKHIPVLIAVTVLDKGQDICIGYVLDISKQKEIEEKGRFFSAIVESSDDAIITKSREGIITSWNNGAQRLYGYTNEEIVGKPVSLLMPPQKKDDFPELMKMLLKGKRIEHYETQRMTKDERIIDVSLTLSLIKDAQGKIIGVSKIARDISDRKKIENNLRFLSETSNILSSSLDYQTTLNKVALLAVPHIADWCAIDMFTDSGEIKLVAVAHKDPKKIKWAKKLREEYPPKMTNPTGVPNVLKTGKAEFYPYITEAMVKSEVRDEREFTLIKKIGLTSIILVPLKAEGNVIGVITFISAESKQRFTNSDFHMAEQLASRASVAIENAMLYQKVQREQERLTNLVANVPGVVWEAWKRPDYAHQRIDFVSNYVEKMLGYTIDEWIRTPNFWLTIVHPEDKKRAAYESAKVFASGKAGISRFRMITKKGKTIWVEAQSSVIKGSHGEPIGMRGVTMDVTQRMELEKRKDDFISMASHELKTPITSIKIFTQILKKTFAQKKEKVPLKYLQKMENQTDKLTHLISDLLDVSKIQAGRLELRKEHFSLQQYIRETVESIQATTDTHTFVIKGSVKRKVYADKERIGQVLINLLTNAIKYSPSAKQIIITIKAEQEKVTVSVQDFGMGIEKEHQQKIFERFYRVFDNTDKTFPGLGMGLYISYQIIKRHRGELGVISKKNNGSTFYFSLPIT